MRKNDEFDYKASDILSSLKKVGICRGDTLFIHSNVGFFGKMEGANDADSFYSNFKRAIFEVIGDEGTIVVPTFSYSFCKKLPFDPEDTPGVCGIFSEMVRKDPQSLRSEDANFSVAAIGKNSRMLTEKAPSHSFGPDSFWERFMKIGGKICNFNFDAGSTFIHYVEKFLRVPYRYDKPFPGLFISGGKKEESVFYHFVYDLEKPGNEASFIKFDKKARESGMLKTANLGKGSITCISASDTFKIIKEELKVNPAFLIKGDKLS
jgi:aminoglycoside 3-N-acetyltransferase